MKERLGQLSGLLLERKNALRSGIGIIAATGITTVSGFLLSVLLARGLGAEQFGLYSLMIGIVGLLLIPVQSGLPLVITRELAKLRVDGGAQGLRAFLRWAAKILLVCLVLVCGAYAIWAFGFASSRGSGGSSVNNQQFLVPIILLLSLWAVTNFAAAVINGFERPFTSRLPDAVIRPLGLLAFAALALAWTEGAQAHDIVLAHAAAAALSATFAIFWAGRLVHRFKGQAEEKQGENINQRAWLMSVLTFSLVSGVAVLNNRIDLIMVGSFSTLAQVAFYNVAMQLTALVTISQIGVNAILAPKAARMFKTGDQDALGRLVSLTCLVTGAIGLATFAVLAVFGRDVLELAFGQEFSASYLPMATMAAAAMIAVASGPVALLLNMAGHERITLVATAIMLAAKIGLNLILIPRFGAQGAAYSTAIVLVSLNLSLTVMLRRKTGIRSGILLLLPMART